MAFFNGAGVRVNKKEQNMRARELRLLMLGLIAWVFSTTVAWAATTAL
jgi:hypothetical protein